jgi:hypothetical protein
MQVALAHDMKRVKARSDWFGDTPTVRLYGDDRDPIPGVGERVILTGGVQVVVQRLGTIRTCQDGFRGVRLWEVDADVATTPPAI